MARRRRSAARATSSTKVRRRLSELSERELLDVIVAAARYIAFSETSELADADHKKALAGLAEDMDAIALGPFDDARARLQQELKNLVLGNPISLDRVALTLARTGRKLLSEAEYAVVLELFVDIPLLQGEAIANVAAQSLAASTDLSPDAFVPLVYLVGAAAGGRRAILFAEALRDKGRSTYESSAAALRACAKAEPSAMAFAIRMLEPELQSEAWRPHFPQLVRDLVDRSSLLQVLAAYVNLPIREHLWAFEHIFGEPGSDAVFVLSKGANAQTFVLYGEDAVCVDDITEQFASPDQRVQWTRRLRTELKINPRPTREALEATLKQAAEYLGDEGTEPSDTDVGGLINISNLTAFALRLSGRKKDLRADD